MGTLTTQAQALLAQVQALFGQSNVRVTSTTRGIAQNAATAGASKTSQHLSGNAFDFVVAGMNPEQVQRIIAGSGIQFGQSIQETGAAAGAGVNHLGVGTKMQLLTGINGKYKVTGIATPGTVATVGDMINTFGKSIGLGDSLGVISNTAGNTLAAPANAVDKLYAGLTSADWFKRVTFGVFALLLIGVALFMLSGKSPGDVAKVATKLAA